MLNLFVNYTCYPIEFPKLFILVIFLQGEKGKKPAKHQKVKNDKMILRKTEEKLKGLK